jgi:hypothetical protein
VGPSQPPTQWVPGDLSLGVKLPGREADNSPPSTTEVKERVELYLHSPNTPSWRGAELKSAQGQLLRKYFISSLPVVLYGCEACSHTKRITINTAVVSEQGFQKNTWI